MDTPIIAVEHLSITLPRGADRRFAVEDVSLEVRRGEILCVVGESGSGKSVLSAALMGALPRGLCLDSGRVMFRGAEDLARASQRRLRTLRGREIAMIFQEPMAALNPAFPVGRQIEEMFAIHAPAMPAAERRERSLQLLADTHLPDPDRIHRAYAHQLSGGQCQRVVIAMALAMQPALLIADEPTTALDVTTQAQILRLIDELKRVHRHGILFVTHDFGVVADIADRVAVMQGGRLVEIGDAAAVLTRPRHAYTRQLLAAIPSLTPRPAGAPLAEEAAMRVEKLSACYGPVRALHEVSFAIPKGATLAVVGESGSGKSTLAKTIIRLTEPAGGRVLIEDEDFATLRGGALTRRRRLIQMIFQDPFGSLNPRRSVGHMLTRAGMLGGARRAEARSRAAALIERVGLKPEALARKPQAFSGGQRQRIGIARALAMLPSIVIADESVSALDVSVQQQVLALLDELQRRDGLTLLFITHDLRVAAQIADLIAVMRRGEIVEFGPAAQILLHPQHPYTVELVGAAPGRAWQRPATEVPPA
jgi:peptide/nickel transport system ATP-binding protein